MGTVNLAKVRKRLLDELAVLEAQQARHSESLSPESGHAGELTDFDSNHPGDMGNDTFERAREAALAGNLEALIAETNAAIAKIDEGTYGTCGRCGRPIAAERLKHIPSATYCIECQTRVENTP